MKRKREMCGKIKQFSTFSTGFSTRFAEKGKKKRKKVRFFGKSLWKTRGKAWKNLFLGENVLKLRPPPKVMAAEKTKRRLWR